MPSAPVVANANVPGRPLEGDPRVPSGRALAALLVVQLLFGAMPVVGKFAIASFGAGGLAFFRICGAALAFRAIASATAAPPMPWSAQPRLMLCAVLGVSANQLLFLHGLARTSATHAALITTTIPVQTLLVAMLLGREPLRGRRLLGVALALAGVLTLLTTRSAAGTESVTGDLMVLANAGCYAGYLVLSRDLLARHAPLSVLPWLFGWGLVTALPFTGLPSVAGASAEGWAAAAFIVLGPTIGSYWLNLVALRTVPASVVALFIYLQPFIAATLAVPLLGERPTLRMAAAAALTFAGVWLATRSGRRHNGTNGAPSEG